VPWCGLDSVGKRTPWIARLIEEDFYRVRSLRGQMSQKRNWETLSKDIGKKKIGNNGGRKPASPRLAREIE
jgi:hypothetical protein